MKVISHKFTPNGASITVEDPPNQKTEITHSVRMITKDGEPTAEYVFLPGQVTVVDPPSNRPNKMTWTAQHPANMPANVQKELVFDGETLRFEFSDREVIGRRGNGAGFAGSHALMIGIGLLALAEMGGLVGPIKR